MLLGLSNLAVLEREEVLAALRAQRQGLAERRERVAGRAAAQQPLPDFVGALFDYSQSMMAARSEWLDSFVEEIKSGRFDWPGVQEQHDGEQEN